MTSEISDYHDFGLISNVNAPASVSVEDDEGGVDYHYTRPVLTVRQRIKSWFVPITVYGSLNFESHWVRLAGPSLLWGRHRVLKPAAIRYDEEGHMTRTRWYNNNVEITDEFIEAVKDLDVKMEIIYRQQPGPQLLITPLPQRVEVAWFDDLSPEDEAYLMLKFW